MNSTTVSISSASIARRTECMRIEADQDLFRSYEHPMNIETISTPATVAATLTHPSFGHSAETHLRVGDGPVRMSRERKLSIPAMAP